MQPVCPLCLSGVTQCGVVMVSLHHNSAGRLSCCSGPWGCCHTEPGEQDGETRVGGHQSPVCCTLRLMFVTRDN